MNIPVWYDQMGRALYRGGFADVWKGKYRDRDVAIKVLRTYSDSDLRKIVGVGYRLCFLPTFVILTVLRVEILQGGGDVENPPAPKRAAVDGGDNVRDPLCNGIKMDGEWKYQRICQGPPECKPVTPGGFIQYLTPLS